MGAWMCTIQYRGTPLPLIGTGSNVGQCWARSWSVGFPKNMHVHDAKPTFQWCGIPI